MRFYLDEDLSPTIAVIARRLGLDVTSAQELKRLGISDEEQLWYATEQGRCLVTVNCDDFWPMSIGMATRGESHLGVLCFRRPVEPALYRRAAEALLRYMQTHPHGIPPYLVDYLPLRG